MNKLLIIQNITREMPGSLAQVLNDEGVTYDVVDLHAGEEFPDPANYAALVVLGGPDSANDDTEKMQAELKRIGEALDVGMPYLGICLGMQTLVKVAGGNVVKGHMKEAGFFDQDGELYQVQATEAGKRDPLLAGLPEVLDVFQLHGETVEITDDMTVLASSKNYDNQIVKVADKAYGIQSHFELTPEMLIVWAENDPDLQPIGKEKLLADFEKMEASYTYIGQTLLRNFLRIAGLLN